MARRVLSEGSEAGRRARLRREQAHLDRDQRHALPPAKPEELPHLGRHRARRLRLLGEGSAARHPPEGARRDRHASSSASSTSGLAELGDKLGPMLWQFAPFKRFDEDDFGKFLDAAAARTRWTEAQPCRRDSPSRASTRSAFVELARDSGVAIVYVDAEGWPSIADLTGDVVYARLQRGDDTLAAAYPPANSILGWPRQDLGERVSARRPSAARHRRSREDDASRRVHLLHP